MSDTKSKIQAILAGPKLASFATVTEDGRPWVRYVVVMTDEELNLRFATFVESRKVAQIRNNPNVHVTLNGSLETESPYLQIEGTARVTTDQEERNAFWSEMLARYFEGPEDPKYAIVIVEPKRIEYWSFEDFAPEVWESA